MRPMGTDPSAGPQRAWLWLLGAVLLAYGLGLGGDFVYDDLHSVRDNLALRDLGNLPAFFYDVDLFSSLDCRLYRPVLLCSLALDAAISGMHPWMFKLSNLGVHYLCGLLLMQLAGGFGQRGWPVLLGACLFAIHPLNSEAVLTISGRSNMLMSLGLLAALCCHQHAMQGRAWWVLGTLGATAVSLGAKEPGMVIPILLVILEGLRIGRAPRQDWDLRAAAVRVLPVALLVMGYVALRAEMLGAASMGVGSWTGGGDVHAGHSRGLSTHLATMCLVLPQALLQFLLPLGLTMDPVLPYTNEWASAPVVLGGLLLAGLVAFGLRAPRRRPDLFFAVCLVCGTAAPWVLKPLNLPFLEHRLYAPMAGLCMVSMLATAWLARLQGRARVLPVFAAYAVLLLGLSVDRSLDFRSSRVLWTAELEHNPESLVAMAGMAVCHIEAREYAAARPLLERLVAAHPDRKDARVNLAEAHLQDSAAGDPAVALEQAKELVARFPDNPFMWLLKSRSEAALAGRRGGEVALYDAAVRSALHCLKIAEPKGLVYRTAAAARRLQGDDAAALTLLDASVAAGLDHYSVLLDRAAVHERLGDRRAARRDLLAAQRQAPFEPVILHRLQLLDHGPARPR